jgi:CubicO group peptidase (beta-lactamase class C family)
MSNKMDKETLHDYIAAHQENICEIEAMRNGKTMYSDCWHGFQPTDTLHVMSVTKSVVSLLIGIALDQGLICDINQPVLDFFPDYTVKRDEKTIQQVTLKHLMTMTAPYKYRHEPWTKVCTSGDWTKAALDLLGGRAGITGEFKYSTLGIHILTGIITKTSGMKTVEFANRYLFEPLGISPYCNFEALTVEEHKEFIMSRQPKKNIWFSDPQGVSTAGYGLCLSAKDMAKLGQLCLDGGVYDGKRVVSLEWITESTKPRIQFDEMFANMSYGYLWWTPNKEKSAYAALGNSGNAIYIDPERSTVVAVNGTFKPRILDRIQFIQEYIEPMLDTCE